MAQTVVPPISHFHGANSPADAAVVGPTEATEDFQSPFFEEHPEISAAIGYWPYYWAHLNLVQEVTKAASTLACQVEPAEACFLPDFDTNQVDIDNIYNNMNHHSSYPPQGMYPSQMHHQSHQSHSQPHTPPNGHIPHSHHGYHHSLSYNNQPHQMQQSQQQHQHGGHPQHQSSHQSHSHHSSLSHSSLSQGPFHPHLQNLHHSGEYPAMIGGQPGRPVIVSSTPTPPAIPHFVPQHPYVPHHNHSSSQIIGHNGIPTPPPIISHAPPHHPPPSMPVSRHDGTLNAQSLPFHPSGSIPPPPPQPQQPPPAEPPMSMEHLVQQIESRFQNMNMNNSQPSVVINTAASFIPPPDSPYTPAPPREVFRPPVPWLSAPGEHFPPRPRRKKKVASSLSKELTLEQPVHPPSETEATETQTTVPVTKDKAAEAASTVETPTISSSSAPNITATTESISVKATSTTKPATSPAPTHVSTPSKAKISVPVVPIIPAVPLPRSTKSAPKSKDGSVAAQSPSTPTQTTAGTALETTTANGVAPVESSTEETTQADPTTTEPAAPPPAPAPAAPKSWADLVRVKNAKPPAAAAASPAPVPANGTPPAASASVVKATPPNGKSAGLAELLVSYEVPDDVDSLAPFLEPRGLINTGNMCFMNAIFQALLFCPPFYLFLDKIGKNVAHSFKSETPLTDAMIMFIREFRIIENKPSSKDRKIGMEPGLAGDAFVPEFIYEVIKGLKRFGSMKRGHQQDAEEFLGFLLDGLHEEAVNAMKVALIENESATNGTDKAPMNGSEQDESSGWLEVGHKQKVSVTRTVGHAAGESPITKIFGGALRSELRKSGQKNSVTREPYQALQLDIQPAHINNIMDALKHLTTPESLSGGDAKTSRGATASVTKQVFIETLPQVLILHLKRFQYDNTGGTQKVYKSIGYPLEFEVPKEIMSPSSRQKGVSKYRLIGVVYHHGKSASGGHYTVDVRRQDGWIRFDDTIVKRIGEDAVKVDTPSPATARRENNSNSSNNGKMDHDENGWEEVSSGNSAKPSSSTLTNGTGSYSPAASVSGKDDKVAYILFFERM